VTASPEALAVIGRPNPGVQPRAKRVGCNDALARALFEPAPPLIVPGYEAMVAAGGPESMVG